VTTRFAAYTGDRDMSNGFDCITDFIFVEDIVSPCDIILVPGGSHPQLAEKAADLYKQQMAEYILFSGHKNPLIPDFPSEAEYLKHVAMKRGIPSESIICEDKASNTFENAKHSLVMLEKIGLKAASIIIVCKAYHSRRSLLTYQCVFPKDTIFLVTTVTSKRGLSKDNWTTKQEHIDKVMGEVEKIGKYFKDKISTYCGIQ
jgi:uncharacterized SAM-binding protein YcdF (DUF218 family)